MVVTGIDSSSDGSSPDGIVTFAAASAPWICGTPTPLRGQRDAGRG